MTNYNFQCTSLLHLKVVWVESEEDNQGYKEMIGHMQRVQLTSDQSNTALEKQQKYYL